MSYEAALLLEECDVSVVARQMRTQWVGRGKRVECLEQVMADWVNARYAVALGSGTAALAAALETFRRPTVYVMPNVCSAVHAAIKFAGKRASRSSGLSISVYPKQGGTIEDYARHLPQNGEAQLLGRYGVFSFGALKDVTGGLGGCLVSNKPFPKSIAPWKRISPLSDINAALILSQLARYAGHHKIRRVADGKLWTAPV